uniref:Vitelline membrane outer layer protein 1 n=1 Tax=Leptobrachium leishanense TaxID=445787 RepID=A0A8C5R3P2_9ANUR
YVIRHSAQFLPLALLGFFAGSPFAISVPNGGSWGNWGNIEWCPQGYVAKGFSLKTEADQGKGDDTAVNGIRLHCFPRLIMLGFFKCVIVKCSSLSSRWGSWSHPLWCLQGYLLIFTLNVEAPQGSGDDTAVNNIKFMCSDGRYLEGNGFSWGSYGDWSRSCSYGICGILTKVEGKQGDGDDTALNDVQFLCC